MASNNLVLFNRKLCDFVNALKECCPEVGEFATWAPLVELAVTMNPNCAHSTFYSMVVEPYGEKIRNKDASFFLAHTYSEHSSADSFANIVDKLKQVWKDMSDENKEAIWKHLQVLMVLCMRVQNE